MVLVPGNFIVFEADGPGRRKPVAIIRSDNDEMLRRAMRASKRDRLFYLDDLVDLAEMSKRTERTKGTIVGSWMKDRLFPKHVKVFGLSKVYFWQDIVEWRRERFRKR